MRKVFEWLDAHPQFYWELAILSTLALLAWIALGLRAAAREKSLRWSGPVFGLLLLGFLVAWRWPYFFAASEYNPDESQFIAGAMALARDPVFWRSVDGVTSGPLDFYALLPLHWLGVPLDYFGARVTALVLTWLMLSCLQRTFRAHAAPAVAQLAVLPGAVFFAAASAGDFVHYSSELAPLVLLALAIACVERRPRVAALVAGCLPWAKLQAAPLAAAIVAWLLWQMWREARANGSRAWGRGAALVACAAAPSLLLIGLVAAFGQFEHFFRRFILQNITYVGEGLPTGTVLAQLHRFASESGHAIPWLVAMLVLLLIGGIVYLRQRAEPPPTLWRDLAEHARASGFFPAWIAAVLLFLLGAGVIYVRRRQPVPRLFWLGALLSATAVFCILAPARGSLHYLLFLTAPLVLWTGIMLADLWGQGSARKVLAASLFLCALVPLGVRLGQPQPDMIGHLAKHWREPYTPLGRVLRHWHQPGSRMALWGWMSNAYVEGGLPQATRDTVSQWCILPLPQRDYYRATFLAEMKQHQPEVFLDAVGPGSPFFFDRSSQAHETYPELADYIRAHYSLVIDMHLARVYVRTDYLAQHPLPPSALHQLVAQGRRDFGFAVTPAATTPSPLPRTRIKGREVSMLHPPAEMLWHLDGSERAIQLSFGFEPKAYTDGITDGAEFIAELHMPGQPPLQVFHRLLDPQRQLGDRGLLSGEADLPPFPPGTTLVVRTTAGKAGDDAWDWVYFDSLQFAYSAFYSSRQFPGFNRTPNEIASPYPYLVRPDAGWMLMLPPPTTLTFALDGNERQLNFSYGLAEGSYTGAGQTDGAIYRVDLVRDGVPPRNIFLRRLDPLGVPADRGRQFADLILPPGLQAGDRIVLRIDPGASTSWDWTYVSSLDLR